MWEASLIINHLLQTQVVKVPKMLREPAQTRLQGWELVVNAKGLFRDKHVGPSQQPSWQLDHATKTQWVSFLVLFFKASGFTCLERGKLRRDSQIDHILKGAKAL